MECPPTRRCVPYLGSHQVPWLVKLRPGQGYTGPLVLSRGGERNGSARCQHIRRAAENGFELPTLTPGPLLLRGRREIRRVASGRARVHPLDDRLDLFVAQRNVVVVRLNTDRGVERPRRHDPLLHVILDQRRKQRDLLVRGQWHRGQTALHMASHAHLLGNRHDILRIRWRVGRHPLSRKRMAHSRGHERDSGKDGCAKPRTQLRSVFSRHGSYLLEEST